MGIQGLLPFVQKACKTSCISDFAGCTVAVDGHGWLHRAGYACAEKLVKGQKTNQYVAYCMRYIEMLKHHKIKPIIVFDGSPLPAKKDTHGARREKKQKNRIKASELEQNGDLKEARTLYGQCFDVTPEMVSQVMQVCREQGVDCLVAPFEADAQLTYLLNQGIVHLVITEDSDLIAFGCKKIFFKLDMNGKGVLYERRLLEKCLGGRATLLVSPGGKNDELLFTRFRYACILSGCDYHPGGLAGVGIQKAMKAVMCCSNISSIERMLARMPQYLGNMHVQITQEYKDNFILANSTFLHQIVFDPLLRRQMPLNPVPPELATRNLSFTGNGMLTDQTAFLLALGFLKADELKCPEGIKKAKMQAVSFIKSELHPDSIWTKKFSKPAPQKSPPRTPRIVRRATVGEVVTIDVSSPLRIRNFQAVHSSSPSAPKEMEDAGSHPKSVAKESLSLETPPQSLSFKRKLNFDDSNDDIAIPLSPPPEKKPAVSWSAPTFKRNLSRTLSASQFRQLNAKQQLSTQKSFVKSSYFAQSSLDSTGSSQNQSASQSSDCSSSDPSHEVIIIDEQQDVADSPIIAAKNKSAVLICKVESKTLADSSTPSSSCPSLQPAKTAFFSQFAFKRQTERSS